MNREQLAANFRTNLRFFRRNRLLLALGLLLLVVTAISATFSLLAGSGTSRFDLLRSTVAELNEFVIVFAGGLALLLVSSHLRNRSLKMVLTKPCPPETWLAAGLLSIAAVSAVLLVSILAGAAGLSWIWKIPFQTGFPLISIECFLRSVIVSGLLMFLPLVVHPVLAVFLIVLFNEDTFYSLRFALLTAIKTTGGNPLLPVFEKASYLLYMVLPSFSPFGERLEAVHGSMRAGGGDWRVLGSIFLYAVAAAGVSFVLSAITLRRKALS